MPRRDLPARIGLALLIGLGAVLAAVGGIALRGAGLLAVALAAVVSACVAVGIAREAVPRRSGQQVAESAWRAAAGTVGVLLVLSGTAAVAGGALTTLLAGCVLTGLVARWLLASRRRTRTRRAGQRPATGSAEVVPLSAGSWPRSLSVAALGQEWVRTSAALAHVREPNARQALVDRRQEALDELERRDPAGFARWLAEGATVDSDPAAYVSADPAAGSDAA